MGFSKDIISDADWASIDFQSSGVPAHEIPSRPVKWSIDRTIRAYVIPLKVDIAWQRDGMGKCLYFEDGKALVLHIKFSAILTIEWFVKKDFDRNKIDQTTVCAKKAICVLYDTTEDRIQFFVSDRWAKISDAELTMNFNLAASMAYNNAQINWLRAYKAGLDEAYKQSWLHGKLYQWSKSNSFDIRPSAKLVARMFFNHELERLNVLLQCSSAGVSDEAKLVFDAINRLGAKGRSD